MNLISMDLQNPDDKELVRFPIEVHLEDEDGMMANASSATVASSKSLSSHSTVFLIRILSQLFSALRENGDNGPMIS